MLVLRLDVLTEEITSRTSLKLPTYEVIDYPSNYVADSEVKMATMSDEKKGMTELEGWIEQLMECKQLSENQVISTTCELLGDKLIDQLPAGESAL